MTAEDCNGDLEKLAELLTLMTNKNILDRICHHHDWVHNGEGLTPKQYEDHINLLGLYEAIALQRMGSD